MVGAKNTIINPINAKSNPLVASLILSSSPLENIYLKPAIITAITTITIEKFIVKFKMCDTNSSRPPKGTLLKLSKNLKPFINATKSLKPFYNYTPVSTPKNLPPTNLTSITATKQIINPIIAHVNDLVAV